MNFHMKLCFSVLALVSTACSSCPCPCPCDSNNLTAASTETWQEPPKMQAVQEVQVAQEAQEIPVASLENLQLSSIIKRPHADLSEQLSLLLEPEQQKMTLLPSAKQKSLDGEQALLTPSAAERTAKSARA